ncbi:MAG: response regulator [Gammaproteobacteria bacterium]
MNVRDLRVLIAYWDPQVCQRIKATFKRARCERLMLARTLRDAAARLSEGPYDVFVTALTFPNSKAWSSVHMVRSGRFCQPQLPIVVVIDEQRDLLVPTEAVENAVTIVSVERLDRIVSAAQTAIDGTEKPNVLVVEDDPHMARFIADTLQDLYRIESAGDGESGLHAWEARRHALVILDIMLPRRSGIEVLETMAAADTDQPVVVLTAYGTAERYNDCVAKGASMFLEKPVAGADLRATCGSVLRQRDYGEVRACLARTQHRIEEFGNRVTAADRYLSSGRTEKAHTELKGAISAFLNASRIVRGPRSSGDET